MRYTVTGAAGFIGSNLVARLKDEGHWVRAVDMNSAPLRLHLYQRADEVCIGGAFHDLRRIQNAARAVADVDRVYHLAADHGGAGYFYSDADWKAARNNLTIDLNIVGSLKPGQRVFFASSACTYPTDIQGSEARAVKESDWGPGRAEQKYGEAKRMSTILIDGANDHGIEARCGIFHTLYGPFQDYLEPRAKFPTAITRKILENPDRVEVWGDGTQVRTFLYIEDGLDRIQAVMDSDEYEGPVNVGSDEEVTVQECCEWAAEAANATPEWVYTDGPTGVPHRASDNTEFSRRYGDMPLISAEEGFHRLHNWLSLTMEPVAKAA